MKLKRLSLAIVLVTLLGGCEDKDSHQIVDESYLESEQYREFERETLSEQSYRSDEVTAFERVLSNLLIHPRTPRLSLPVSIDSVSLKAYTDSSMRFELNHTMLNEPSRLNFAYYPVGKTELEQMSVLFFIIEKRSVYDDRELAVATFNDSSVIAVQSLAEFVKNLSQEVQSNVQIDKSLDITSEINRRTLSPIPQDYTTVYRYSIGNDGRIDEEVQSEND